MRLTELWLKDTELYEVERALVFCDSLPVVACYLRVSSPEQAEENHSIETQAKILRRACEHRFPNGAHLVYVSDEGFSGTLPYKKPGLRPGEYRPGLTLLAKLAEHGYIHCIGVYKCNRFTRSLRVWYEFDEDYMDKYAIDFFSATEPVSNRSVAGRFITNLLMASSSFERDQIVSAAQHGLKQRQAEGYPIGVPPYGWRCEDRRRLPKGQRPCFEPVEEQAEIVRRVIHEYLSGASMQSLVTALTISRYPTPTGKRAWNIHTVKRILTSPIHCGLMKDASGNLVRGKHYSRRIIEEEQYFAVQERIRLVEQRSTTWQKRRESLLNRLIFDELIRCGLCGKAISVHSTTEGESYTCHATRKGCDHGTYSIGTDILEDRLVQELERLCSEPVIIEHASHEVLLTLDQQRTSLESVIKDLESKLAAVDGQFIRAARDYNRGSVDKEVFTVCKSALRSEREDLSDEIEKTQAKLKRIGNSAKRTENALDVLRQFLRVWKTLENAERRQLATSLINAIELKPRGSSIEVKMTLACGGNQVFTMNRWGKPDGDPHATLTISDLAAVHCFIEGHDEIEVARIRCMSVNAVRNLRYKLTRLTGTKDLTKAIETVAPLVAVRIQEVQQALEQPEKIDTEALTLEEIAVMECVAKNMLRAEIARTLDIPADRVTSIRMKVNSKLCARDWREAVIIATERGLISANTVDLDKPSKRQMQTLQHYAVGGCIGYCAQMLSIAYTSAREHLRIMRVKYEVRSNDDLITLAVSKGWIP